MSFIMKKKIGKNLNKPFHWFFVVFFSFFMNMKAQLSFTFPAASIQPFINAGSTYQSLVSAYGAYNHYYNQYQTQKAQVENLQRTIHSITEIVDHMDNMRSIYSTISTIRTTYDAAQTAVDVAQNLADANPGIGTTVYASVAYNLFMPTFENSISRLETDKKRLMRQFAILEFANQIERAGSSNLRLPNNTVNFTTYSGICSNYFIPFKRVKCNDRFAFLQEAYTVVQDLLSSNTQHEISKGRQELIWEKYAAISNLIISDMNRIRDDSRKRNFLNLINYN